MSVLLLVLGLALFIGLVVTHEFGHFIMARRGGVEVEEFGIFFPPRLYKRTTKGGWLFSFNLLPLGGFVKLKGEHDSDTEPGTFGAASLAVKTKIMAAGVAVNLITALILFMVVALVGLPKLVNNQFSVAGDTKTIRSWVLIDGIQSGSPAAKAGLKSNDQLSAIGLLGHKPVNVNDSTLPQLTKRFAHQEVALYINRNDHQMILTTKLLDNQTVEKSKSTNNPRGYLGVDIIPYNFQLQRSTWSAPIVAAGLTGQLTALTFQGLGHSLGGVGSMIAGAVTGNKVARQNGQTNATTNVAGPVGIFKILESSSQIGYQFTLFIVAYVSLALAIMNLLPIPALDGGRLWITLIARAIKRPLSAKREDIINVAGFVVLISLMILITIVDVRR